MFFGKWKKWKKGSGGSHEGGMSAFYGLGGLGVLIYYLQLSQSAGDFLLAFVKAFLWPAFLTYNLYGFLGIS